MSRYIDGEKLLEEFNALVQIANNELTNLTKQTELDFKAKHYEWRRWATILSERGIYAYKVEKAMDEGVEIVRCKECIYCEHWYADKGICTFWDENGIDVFGDGFCSYGKKRDNPTTGWRTWGGKILKEDMAGATLCKECKFAEKRNGKTHCLKHNIARPEDWYCKEGEKK